MLREITPVILTYNEALNLERTLSQLTWAKDIVILDSGSTDNTHSITNRFPQVRWFERPFDTHATQWRYAITNTGIRTSWVLRLDADYIVTERLLNELSILKPDNDVIAFRISFDYAVHGRKLRSSLYPAKPTLFRRDYTIVTDHGHTEVWHPRGIIHELRGRIIHDDRKPCDRWLTSQIRYMYLEADRLNSEDSRASHISDRIRRIPFLMPFLIFLYLFFAKGLIFDGLYGFLYSLQRMVSESILSLIILDKICQQRANKTQQK